MQHCGIRLRYSDGAELAARPDQSLVKLPSKETMPTKCLVPDELPVDLRSKLAVCMIHLKWMRPVQVSETFCCWTQPCCVVPWIVGTA